MNTYFGGRFDRDAILRDLGREFLGSGTLYKRWPCVGTAHSHMKAAIDIVTRNGLDLDDITEIRLHVGDYHDHMCQPLEERRAPATLADAKFIDDQQHKHPRMVRWFPTKQLETYIARGHRFEGQIDTPQRRRGICVSALPMAIQATTKPDCCNW